MLRQYLLPISNHCLLTFYNLFTGHRIIIIIITKELIKVTPSQLQTVTGALYNTLSPVTHQGMTAEKVFV